MDAWEHGAAYEVYIGRWSRLVAQAFLDWLARPAGERWLDVGCGAGALSEAILVAAAPAQVIGIDTSAGFVAHTASCLSDERAEFLVADAQALPYDDAAFDTAVSGLVLNFLPNPARGLAEMTRVTRSGGIVAIYLWDYAEGMQAIRRFWDAAIALDPAAAELDEAARFPICRPEPLARLFTELGLGEIEVRAVEIPTVFRDFDDYWSPFLGGQGPAPGYVAALPVDHRDALRERLRADLPIESDGSIRLTARAWAARGIVQMIK